MSALLKPLLTIFVCLSLGACIELEEDADSDTEEFKRQLTFDIWYQVSQESTSGLSIPQWQWTFTSDNKFTQRIESFTPNGFTETVGPSGTYSIEGKVSMSSGHTAFAVNLYFDSNHLEVSGLAPDPHSMWKLTTIYIEDETLYFGELKPLSDCSSEEFYNEWVFAGDQDELEILDDYISHSPLLSPGQAVCHGRPHTLNFNQPHVRILQYSSEIELIDTTDQADTITIDPTQTEPNETISAEVRLSPL